MWADMARRNYSNVAVETTLVSGIDSDDTSLSVAVATGWPAAPFLLVIDPGTVNEELILVENKSGTTFSSLTRGFGGTVATSHSGSAVIRHALSAEDHSLIWTHEHTGSGGDGTTQLDLSEMSGSLDHGGLSGLSDDDHPQYLLIAGFDAALASAVTDYIEYDTYTPDIQGMGVDMGSVSPVGHFVRVGQLVTGWYHFDGANDFDEGSEWHWVPPYPSIAQIGNYPGQEVVVGDWQLSNVTSGYAAVTGWMAFAGDVNKLVAKVSAFANIPNGISPADYGPNTSFFMRFSYIANIS